MTSVYTMLKDLVEFCEKDNVKLNHANEIVNGEYSISLAWKPTEHDGSVCKKLPLDDIEDTVIKHVPMQELVVDKMSAAEPVTKITVTTGSPTDTIQVSSSSDNKEEVEAWNKLGKKEYAEEKTTMSPIEEGDHVIYSGKIKEYQGMKARVDKVADKCYVLRFLDNDVVIHANKDLVTKVVY